MIVSLIKSYLICLVSFLLLDAVWFYVIAGTFFKKHLGFILRLKEGQVVMNPWGATMVYLLLPLGLLVFVLTRMQASTLSYAPLLFGFLYGVIVYGVYEGTNLALLRGWPATVVGIDVLWGGVSCAMVSLLLHRITERM